MVFCVEHMGSHIIVGRSGIAFGYVRSSPASLYSMCESQTFRFVQLVRSLACENGQVNVYVCVCVHCMRALMLSVFISLSLSPSFPRCGEHIVLKTARLGYFCWLFSISLPSDEVALLSLSWAKQHTQAHTRAHTQFVAAKATGDGGGRIISIHTMTKRSIFTSICAPSTFPNANVPFSHVFACSCSNESLNSQAIRFQIHSIRIWDCWVRVGVCVCVWAYMCALYVRVAVRI